MVGKRTVLLFADGSKQIGIGHQVRCAALARALRPRGKAILACRDLPGSAHAWTWDGDVTMLDGAWTPRRALTEAIERHAPDAVVIDHLDVDGDTIAEVARDRCCLLIDDIVQRNCSAAHLVLNSSPSVTPENYPSNPVALGLPYALLRPEFAQKTGTNRQRNLAMIALGGTDHMDLVPSIIRTLLAQTTWRAVAVTASRHPEIERLAEEQPDRVQARAGLDAGQLAELMRTASLGVISASTLTLEASAAGMPFIAILTAENQYSLAEGLRRHGIVVLGESDVQDFPRHLDKTTAARLPVDGLGAARAAMRIEELLVSTPHLRLARWQDAELLLSWANDPVTRASSFSSVTIQRDEHLHWLRARLLDPETRLWIGHHAGAAVGTVRLQRDGDHAEVSIAVAPAARNKGMGKTMLKALESWTRQTGFCRRIDAWVRADNPASLALFAACGYRKIESAVRNGEAAYLHHREIA